MYDNQLCAWCEKQYGQSVNSHVRAERESQATLIGSATDDWYTTYKLIIETHNSCVIYAMILKFLKK